MEPMTILAQAAETATETTAELSAETELMPVDVIWEQIAALSWLEAVLAISFGIVYMLYGWRIFKALVVICFGLVGIFSGIEIGQQFGEPLVGAVAGLIILALLSVPLMRWAVSLLGALAGGILTSGLWYASELPGKYILAGAAIGIIAGGMISFIIFKIAVMLFTSLGGGALVVAGLVALLHQYEAIQEPPTEKVQDLFLNHNWFMPILLLLATVIGMAIQNKLIKGSPAWKV